MAVNDILKTAIKLNDKPAYKIAQEAGLNLNVFFKIINGAIDVKPGDLRVARVAKILGLKTQDLFE